MHQIRTRSSFDKTRQGLKEEEKPPQKKCIITTYKLRARKKIEANFKQPFRLTILLDMPIPTPEEQSMYAWNAMDGSPDMVVEEDKITVCRRVMQNSTDGIRGKVGFTKGLHIWEIIWPAEQRGTHACVGVATSSATLQKMGYYGLCQTGLDIHSWVLNLCTGIIFHNASCARYPSILGHYEAHYAMKFQDIMVILDMDQGTLSFKVDGQYLGEAFKNIKGRKVYPFVSSVVGYSKITMRYMGSLEPGPPKLQVLCRHTVRKRLHKTTLEDQIKLLGLPKSIEKFMI